MLTRKDLHRLRGPAQLREDEAEKMFKYLQSFGVISGQPRDTFVKPLSPFRDFVYLPETRREDVKSMSGYRAYDGPIQDWYNYHLRGIKVPLIKTDNPRMKADLKYDPSLKDVILAVGVHYPATPSTEIYTATGRYRFSIAGLASGKTTTKELGKQLVKLAKTPRIQLKQTDADWSQQDANRYYTKTGNITTGGKDYEVGQGPWFEKSNGLLNEPAIFMESIEAAYNTNGHIFFIIGNPRVELQTFNAINYKVIS